MKVLIGFGSIWGLFALGGILISSFTFGANDTAPEVIGLLLYGFTFLPACILGLWYRKAAAIWLIILSAIAAFGFIYQISEQIGSNRSFRPSFGTAIWMIFLASIPAFFGICMLRTRPIIEDKGQAK